MKQIYIPLLLLLTLTANAQIIHWPSQRTHADYPPPITRENYAQVHRQYPWLPDGMTGNIANNPDLLKSLEVYPLIPFVVPDGMVKIAGTRQYVLGDGVATETWETETQAEVDVRQAAAERAALLATGTPQAPVLDAHPAGSEIPDGGMYYRLPDASGNLTLWYVRDADHIATQLSAHDEQGREIRRAVNLDTGEETTIIIDEVMNALPPQAQAKARQTRTIPRNPQSLQF